MPRDGQEDDFGAVGAALDGTDLKPSRGRQPSQRPAELAGRCGGSR
ncbi:hypothetical protein LRS13_13630 [Svornostia abyssi]|uniref:Uncharacterized protein n=1 Tax=Svornostia abyssi TaxID=2898438 RepID=A0ABY5PAR3_9ACTN|nr:hypothetical protein LRS13_13630 [Parviterribacteraceae bacterium J379]